MKNEAPCSICYAVQGCRECNNDSQVGIVEREGVPWLSVTTWEDFAEGTSLFMSKVARRGVGNGEETVDYDVWFAPGGIKKVFDGAHGANATAS